MVLTKKNYSYMTEITKTVEWCALKDHFEKMKSTHMRDLFSDDSKRFEKNHILFDDLLFDFSKNRITEETKKLLISLAKTADIENWRKRLFSGDKINFTENRSALHIALRNRSNDPIMVDGKDVMPLVNAELSKIKKLSKDVRSGSWKGYSGEKITSIVNIGIGGSDLGPSMVCEALKPFGSKEITPHFVSNVDAADLSQVLDVCDPETTLFIIASKTFTTQETMTNAFSARDWFINKAKKNEFIKKHFVAISSNSDAVIEFGIHPENIFVLWDWVGGRYSLWSSIGLSIAIFIGMKNFEELLEGGHEADNHFIAEPMEKNIPIMMALIGVWYINFFDFSSYAILPYDQCLTKLPAYLQQADMESNGKFIGRDNKRVCLKTGPILWGEAGTNGQHAFYQLLHQGTEIVPCDFVMPVNSNYSLEDDKNKHHQILQANFIAQTQSLMTGKSIIDVQNEMRDVIKNDQTLRRLVSHRMFEGNRPSNSILFKSLTPRSLGRLVALYEHKIFTQGIIWNINSFDQWGVEYGKQIAKLVLPELDSKKDTKAFDSSTNNLINYINNIA